MQMVCGESQAGAAGRELRRDGRREPDFGPAQQVIAQIGEQEAVSGNPADGFEHAAKRGRRSPVQVWAGQRCQRGAQASACRRKRRIQNWPRW